LTKTELASVWRADGHCGVLGEFGTRVEGEDEPALELEDDDCARRARVLVDEVGCDDAIRLQAEAVAIEDERAFEVVDPECDDVEAGFHRSASPWRHAYSSMLPARMGLIACHYPAAEWRHKENELAAHELLQYPDASSARPR
jgi:hypothetical protein